MNSSLLHFIPSSSKTDEIIRTLFQILTAAFFCVFLCFILLLLYVFFTTPRVRDNARYVLFAHMLLNDTLYLTAGIILLLLSFSLVYLPVPVCYILVTVAAVTFRITPYNLAAMALERYIAICLPLRHVTLCTLRRSNYVIVIIWVIGLIPNLADIIILSTAVEKVFFALNVICSRDTLIVTAMQNSIRSYTLIISLVLVGLIIVLTYVRVMLIAKNIKSSTSSASKASKTIVLHAFQFLLCLISLTSPLIELQLRGRQFLPLMNFFFLSCLPRFLSPLVYGVRDKAFSKCIRQFGRVLVKP